MPRPQRSLPQSFPATQGKDSQGSVTTSERSPHCPSGGSTVGSAKGGSWNRPRTSPCQLLSPSGPFLGIVGEGGGTAPGSALEGRGIGIPAGEADAPGCAFTPVAVIAVCAIGSARLKVKFRAKLKVTLGQRSPRKVVNPCAAAGLLEAAACLKANFFKAHLFKTE